MTNVPAAPWPELPRNEWRATYATLHMWSQIVGKTRLALAPMENHWWQVAFYLTARGLTTSAMPHGNRSVEVQFDFMAHQLMIQVSDGSQRSFPLASMTVAEFFARYMNTLHELGIDPAIYASPVEVVTAIPFAQDRGHAIYNADAAQQCWLIILNTQRVMKNFRGAFTGKQSPVHFFGAASISPARASRDGALRGIPAARRTAPIGSWSKPTRMNAAAAVSGRATRIPNHPSMPMLIQSRKDMPRAASSRPPRTMTPRRANFCCRTNHCAQHPIRTRCCCASSRRPTKRPPISLIGIVRRSIGSRRSHRVRSQPEVAHIRLRIPST